MDDDELVDGWTSDSKGRMHAVLGSGLDAVILPPRGKRDLLYGLEISRCGVFIDATSFDSMEECLDYAHEMHGIPNGAPSQTVMDCTSEPGGLLHWLLEMRVQEERGLAGLLPALEDVRRAIGTDAQPQDASVRMLRSADPEAFLTAVTNVAATFVECRGKLGCKPKAFATAVLDELRGELMAFETPGHPTASQTCNP